MAQMINYFRILQLQKTLFKQTYDSGLQIGFDGLAEYLI